MRQWATRVACAVLAAEAAFVLGYAATHRAVDFGVYMWGGRAIAHGTRLYLRKAGGHWFTYPPFAAALFAPVSALPEPLAQVLWDLASLAAFAVACQATLRLAGCRPARTAVAAVTAAGLLLEPVYHTLFNGQVNLLLLALVLTDVWRASRGRRAGIGVGIAAAVKLTPAIFAVLFLLARRPKATLTAAAAFAGCGMAGYLANPAASRLYWTRFFYDTKRVDAPYLGNQSIYGAAIRIFGGAAHVGGWYLPLAAVVAVAGLGTAVVFARDDDWLSAAVVTGVTSLLVSPVSWTHHWVWVVPALVMLARGGTGHRIAAAAGYVLFAVAPLWLTPHSLARPDYGFHWLLTLVADCYVAAGLAFLGYMAWRAVRTVNDRRHRAVAGARDSNPPPRQSAGTVSQAGASPRRRSP